MENYKRVLVVNRMSEYCRDAVQAGISIARKYGSELMVLHIATNPEGTMSMAGGALNAPSAIPDEVKNYASIQERAKEELEQMIGQEIRAGLPIKVIIKEGKPVDEIVQTVKDERIDLMVLLSHEEGRIEHMLFGRDNDAVLRRMPCSILLIKREPESVEW
ncbi:universal stress protein [Geomonas ferrireducens]|uniref:universal stress protein n=1 Tax=Geomonas ferrireducens TaxID=2570227 RepID=UPI0010A78725|nr:universal stress protein [Geomonas ferrireducens]